jgi:EAL and modified HD-GYP domain-containing signal transduction protein
VTQALRCAFRQLATGTAADTVFVRVTRAFLAGDLPVPVHPERIVVEVDGTVGCDAVVQDGLLRLKALGCRVALGDFTGRADQRRLLPFADYVKVDARDLDLEGTPLLELATSRGAELVGEFVDTDETLLACRAAGFVAVQGRALQGPADAASAAVAASAVRLASAASR